MKKTGEDPLWTVWNVLFLLKLTNEYGVIVKMTCLDGKNFLNLIVVEITYVNPNAVIFNIKMLTLSETYKGSIGHSTINWNGKLLVYDYLEMKEGRE